MSTSSAIDQILAKTMMYLMETASKDGIITDDERELINSFEVTLRKYERALHVAFEDGIITKEEELELERIKETIIESGRTTATVDGLSKDEMNLLISVMLSLEIPKNSEE